MSVNSTHSSSLHSTSSDLFTSQDQPIDLFSLKYEVGGGGCGIGDPEPIPKISQVWSVNNNLNHLTPSFGSTTVAMQPLPLPPPVPPVPLRVKVPLPDRQALLINSVHQLELVLQYGEQEEQVLMIDLHCPMQFPTQRLQEPGMGEEDNSIKLINQWENIDEKVFPTNEIVDILPPKKRLQSIFHCSRCEESFPARNVLTRHMKRDHPHPEVESGRILRPRSKPPSDAITIITPEEPIIKQITAKTGVFKREKTTKLQEFQCNLCKKGFASENSLTTHYFLHTGRKPYACGQCGKKFTQKGNMLSHQSLHTRGKSVKRPFKCPQCKKSFIHKGSLATHFDNLHLNIRYPCGICERCFSQKGNLQTHERLIHGIIQKP